MLPPAAYAQTVSEVTEYSGMCDASAALALGPTLFVVANDEDNILRIYRRGQRKPIDEISLNKFLKIKKKKGKRPEVDIEGVTRIGDRTYWISSHGRNKEAEERPERHRFFALDIVVRDGAIKLEPVGKPYRRLMDDLLDEDSLKPFKLDKSEEKAPKKKDGLNIEGLAATRDGKILVGFRNPIRDKKALLVSIDNPHEVIQGARAKLGPPIALDLGNRGIRSIELVESRKAFVIVAGAYDQTADFRLFEWSGARDQQPKQLSGKDFGDLRPESLLVFPGESSKIHLLSDDGTRKVDGEDCKDLDDEEEQSFRSFAITP